MVIKIENAAKLTKQEEKTISKLEKDIDRFIEVYYEDKNSTVPWEVPEEYTYNQRILNELKRKYTQAGWNVSIKKDKREGGDVRESWEKEYLILNLRARSKK